MNPPQIRFSRHKQIGTLTIGDGDTGRRCCGGAALLAHLCLHDCKFREESKKRQRQHMEFRVKYRTIAVRVFSREL